MNPVSAVLILTFITICSCSSVPHGSLVFIDTALPGCSTQEVVRTTTCICFVTSSFLFPTSQPFRDRCELATHTTIANSQSACDPFVVDNGTNYDFAAILDTVIVAMKCFGGNTEVPRPLLITLQEKFSTLNKATKIFVVLKEVFRTFPSSTPTPMLFRVFVGRNRSGSLPETKLMK